MSAGPALIATMGAVVGAGVFSRAVFMPRSQICGPVIYRGPTNNPSRIALTFDDGPDPAITPHILTCLKRHDVRASFFVVGRHAAAHPSLVEQIDAGGHLIGNHSYSHAHLGTMRRDRYWNDEIRRTDDVIEQITGRRPAFFRPPMGFKTWHITRAAKLQNHAIVTWTRRAYDGVGATSDQIMKRLCNVKAGDIVLLHDGAVAPFRISPDATVAALDRWLERCRARELTIQRLDEFLALPAYAAPISVEPASASGPAQPGATANGVECRAASRATAGNA